MHLLNEVYANQSFIIMYCSKFNMNKLRNMKFEWEMNTESQSGTQSKDENMENIWTPE
jgi:hypothetical protein